MALSDSSCVALRLWAGGCKGAGRSASPAAAALGAASRGAAAAPFPACTATLLRHRARPTQGIAQNRQREQSGSGVLHRTGADCALSSGRVVGRASKAAPRARQPAGRERPPAPPPPRTLEAAFRFSSLGLQEQCLLSVREPRLLKGRPPHPVLKHTAGVLRREGGPRRRTASKATARAGARAAAAAGWALSPGSRGCSRRAWPRPPPAPRPRPRSQKRTECECVGWGGWEGRGSRCECGWVEVLCARVCVLGDA